MSIFGVITPLNFFCNTDPTSFRCHAAYKAFGIDPTTGTWNANIGSAITTLLPNLLIFAGVIFFLLILGGGFMMIKSAGGDANAQDAAKAKNAVTFAVIGFLLVISAYFILQILKMTTGVDFLNPPSNI